MSASFVDPFVHQRPLAPDEFVGRVQLLDELRDRVRARPNVAVSGPSGSGVTSLLRAAAAGDGRRWVIIEVGASDDEHDVVGAMAAAIRTLDVAELRSPASTSQAAELLQAADAIGQDRDRSGFEPRWVMDLLVDVLIEHALREPMVFVVDGLPRLSFPMVALLRSRLQWHYRDMGLVLAGTPSQPMIRQIADPAAPFYLQAEHMQLPPLDTADVRALVAGGFVRTGRDPGTVPDRIAAAACGHPRSTMRLASEVWQRTPPGACADAAWTDALDANPAPREEQP